MENIKKIRILTYHHVANNGAILQAYSLCNALENKFNDYDVKILDYRSIELELYEILKIFKIYWKIPLFNILRYIKFKTFIKKNLKLDTEIPRVLGYNKAIKFLESKNYDVLVVGSDAIWKISDRLLLPKFPNVYWLSKYIDSKKIAYAACAYHSDLSLVSKHKDVMKDCLNAFDIIGVRDEFTLDMVENCNINNDVPILKMPDPTFLFKIKKTNVDTILTDLGIDLDKPILGILLYNEDVISKSIRDYFKSKGHQIVALSMYNPYADLNLGHILDPFEWAEIFKYLTFCITDRFHGTIFCLKNKTPFISVEPTHIKSTKDSKIYSLLTDFNMLECYTDPHSVNFDKNEFLSECLKLLYSWSDEYKNNIDDKLRGMENEGRDFIDQIERVINI